MADPALQIRILDVALFERAMTFTHPFRFGVVEVAAAPQAFVRVELDVAGHGRAIGASAEMMMPKWFDKAPDKTPGDTIDDLRESLANAAALYAAFGTQTRSPFALHAQAYAAQGDWARRRNLPALVAAYGPAVIDRAVLDAAFKAADVGFLEGLRTNLPGLDARLTADLAGFDLDAFLAGLNPSPAIAIRHTVGLVDDLADLSMLIGAEALSHLKIKLGGDVAADVTRLQTIAGLLEAQPRAWRVTLDANESYDAGRLDVLLRALAQDRSLKALRAALLYIEQPFARATTFAAQLGEAAEQNAFIIDEADGDYDAFPRAVTLGYRGVSSKGCKGLYKSILNAARVSAHNSTRGAAHLFVTAEDLTCQAGLSVQQDTALAAALGLTHAERNGHHYVSGFGTASHDEAAAFAAAQSDLYGTDAQGLALATREGRLLTERLLQTPGFASGAMPDWASLKPLDVSPFAKTHLETIAS